MRSSFVIVLYGNVPRTAANMKLVPEASERVRDGAGQGDARPDGPAAASTGLDSFYCRQCRGTE